VEWTAEDSSETLTLSSLQSEILCVEWDVLCTTTHLLTHCLVAPAVVVARISYH